MFNTGRRWLLFIPVASIMYMLAFCDRTNISFAMPYIGHELELNNSDKGLISGIFFIGYILLQIPAALLAEKWSAKKTIFLLLIFWGITSVCTGYVRNLNELLIVRFILGVFEGGIQPATLVLMLKWFPQHEKARASGFWLLCIPVSAIVAAPLIGLLLESYNWRTVMIMAGCLPVIWSVVWALVIADSPEKCWWIKSEESKYISDALQEDNKQRNKKSNRGNENNDPSVRTAIFDKKLTLVVLAWFFYCAGFYGFTMWLPQVISNISGGSSTKVGLMTAVPYLVGLVGMILISVRTDKKGLSKLTILAPLALSAIMLFVGQLFNYPGVQFLFLCLVAAGLYVHGPFFSLPPVIINPKKLALALGLIGGIGNLGGFIGPYLVGWLIDTTGTPLLGFAFMSMFLLLCGILLSIVTPTKNK